ncbi:anti-sigma factor domain-containing protein [Lacinutrix undariae]
MKKELQTFLNAGLLDKYILGTATPEETQETEHYIDTYPEVEAEYIKLQNNLETLANVQAVEAPAFILDAIHEELDDTPVIALQTETPVSKTPWYSIAASIAAFIFAGYSFMLFQQNRSLTRENQVVVDEIFDIRNDINSNNEKLDNMMRQFMKLNNPETEKYVLRGNDRAKDLKTVAYINAVDKTSLIDVVSLPQLPENQTYQIWAELQDRMVNLGILDTKDKRFKNIPYMEDALGLSITIEPKGTPNTNSADNEVAEITLKNIK